MTTPTLEMKQFLEYLMNGSAYDHAYAQSMEQHPSDVEVLHGMSACDLLSWIDANDMEIASKETRILVKAARMLQELVKAIGDTDTEAVDKAHRIASEAVIHDELHVAFSLGVAYAIDKNLIQYKEGADAIKASDPRFGP